MHQRGRYGVQDQVEVLSNIFRQEPQHHVTVPLEKRILPTVSAVSICIRQVLGAIQLNRKPFLRGKKINFHFAAFIKGDRQPLV
jgi:hypothetical protein